MTGYCGFLWNMPFTCVLCSGGALVSISKVNLPRARLVVGWVTMSGFSSRCKTFKNPFLHVLNSSQKCAIYLRMQECGKNFLRTMFM